MLSIQGRISRAGVMAETTIPHFHNNPGVPEIYVGSKEFMCIGARPPFDHPHIFLDMGYDNEILCSYCSTHFKYDPSLKPGEARPIECLWDDRTTEAPTGA